MIRNIYIIGMGALGVLFGHLIKKNLQEGEGTVQFIADPDRIVRYKKKTVACNGEVCDFSFVSTEETGKTADLIIFATKTTGIAQAVDAVKNYVGKDTILISVLNGISSEEVISERYGNDHVIPCIARGMDATKLGDELVYSSPGQLLFGAEADAPHKQADVEALTELFLRTKVPHTVCDDIMHVMWSKFMLNVGLNQSMMVYETNYGGMIDPGVPRDTMIAAMREVVALSQAEGINLTEEDVQSSLALTDTLGRDGYTSMRQDGINRRYSEVESFAGTVLRLAEKHGIPAPVNQFLYDKVKEIESTY